MAISVSQAFKDAFKGPVDRTMIKVEVYFSAGLGWVDITPWVEAMNGTMEEVSSLTGGASANTLSLTLNNDDGRFSRKNTASPYYAAGLGLVPNKPIRVSAVYGSETVRIFTGYSGPWNTNAKNRTCTVPAQDAARLLRTREVAEEILMDPANPGQGYYLTKVIERAAWLAGLRWDAVTTKAAAWTFTSHDGNAIVPAYDAGAVRAVYTQGGALVMTLDLVDLYLPVTHLKGNGLELIAKLAGVVDGKVYFDGQGQLVFRARMYRNDSTLTSVETFTVSSLEDVTVQANFEQSQFAPLINKATVKAAPLAPWLDESGNWTEREIEVKDFSKALFSASETYPGVNDPSLFLEVPDGTRLHRTTSPAYPTATNLTVRSVDPNDLTRDLNGIRLSGSPTFFASSVKLALVNSGSGSERLASITIRAKLFQAKQGCWGAAENSDSQNLYGQRATEISNNFIPSVTACEQLAAWLVEDGRGVKDYLTLPVMYGLPWQEINDRVTVSETITGSIPVAEDFIVKRIPWSWTLGAFAFTLEACTPSPTFNVSSLPSTAAIIETANVNLSASVRGGLPPQAISGVNALVGLNNTPAFANIVGKVKTISGLTPAPTALTGIAFDGSDIFVVNYDDSYPYVYKINPMTGEQVDSQILGPSDPIYATYVCVAEGLIFVSDTLNGEVVVSDTATLGTFTTKAALPGGSYHDPRGIISANGKLYCVGRAYPSGALTLFQWNDITATRNDDGDATYTVTGASSDSQQLAFDGRYIWITVTDGAKLARFDTQTNTMTQAAIDLGSGNKPLGIAHDGQNIWVSLTSGMIWRYRVTRDGSGNPAYVQDETIVIDPNGINAATGLLFDGTYIWTVTVGEIIQIATTGQIVARYAAEGAGAGLSVFDGAAIWATGFGQHLYRVPRLVSGRQF